jgi:hypothetical protein
LPRIQRGLADDRYRGCGMSGSARGGSAFGPPAVVATREGGRGGSASAIRIGWLDVDRRNAAFDLDLRQQTLAHASRTGGFSGGGAANRASHGCFNPR